eukprot:5073077-Amphidinium_carterae.1
MQALIPLRLSPFAAAQGSERCLAMHRHPSQSRKSTWTHRLLVVAIIKVCMVMRGSGALLWTSPPQ